MSKIENSLTLREQIAEIIDIHKTRCSDPYICVDEPSNDKEWKGCYGHIADRILEAVAKQYEEDDSDLGAVFCADCGHLFAAKCPGCKPTTKPPSGVSTRSFRGSIDFATGRASFDLVDVPEEINTTAPLPERRMLADRVRNEAKRLQMLGVLADFETFYEAADMLDAIRHAVDAEPFKSSYESDCCRKAYGHGEDDFAGVIAAIIDGRKIEHA